MRRVFASLVCVLTLGLASASARANDTPPSNPGSPDDSEGKGEQADDLNLMTLLNVEVSTATKTSESIQDAPAVITVVTHEDIERWG
jgi:outer membrane receptor for ferrienterochelin and colicins